MEKLNRKGFFSTLFGGIAGVVAGSTVKASEPTPVVETVVYCDKLVFTHSSGASCVMSFKDSDNFTVRVNNSENISINIHSPLKKPDIITVKSENTAFKDSMYSSDNCAMTVTSNGNLGLGTAWPKATLDIRDW
jgi:hypothetical protein